MNRLADREANSHIISIASKGNEILAKLNKLNGEIKDNKHKLDTTIKNAHLICDDIQRNQQRVNDTLTTGYNTVVTVL